MKSDDFEVGEWYIIQIDNSGIRTNLKGKIKLQYVSYELTPDFMLCSPAEYFFKNKDGEIISLYSEQIDWKNSKKG